MKKRNIIYCFLVLGFVCLLGCGPPDYENPIIEKWWQEDEPEIEYVPTITKVPEEIPDIVYETIYETIYETVYETISPDLIVEEILDNVTIFDIKRVTFSERATVYNSDGRTPDYNSLRPDQKILNDEIIDKMTKALLSNPDYLMIIHGYAPNAGDFNHIQNIDGLNGLIQIGMLRTKGVEKEIKRKFTELGGDVAALDKRIFLRWKDMGAPIYEDVEHDDRVDLILIRIEK